MAFWIICLNICFSISFGGFMTDLYCRFWIWIDRGRSLISAPLYSPVEEKNFLESYFFKIPRLPSHSQMDEQLPRAFKQSFNQFHGTAADQFWRWCRDIADVNLFHLNHQRRALIGEPEVFNLSRCLARLCTFRISTSLDFHLYFPTFLISTSLDFYFLHLWISILTFPQFWLPNSQISIFYTYGFPFRLPTILISVSLAF